METRMNSWDRFQIPLPFARCEVTVGRAIRVPRETTDPGREELRKNSKPNCVPSSRD